MGDSQQRERYYKVIAEDDVEYMTLQEANIIMASVK